MIIVTQTAQEEVAKYFNGKEKSPVRLFITSGCGGPSLAMALDQPKETDTVFTQGDVDYIMETELLKQAQPVTVDYTGMGFNISSSLELGGGGCSSCDTGGGCSGS
jgi:Fe-S cluster assembly iron-binding protein IscA